MSAVRAGCHQNDSTNLTASKGSSKELDHGRAWNGRPADQLVTGLGDGVTGIETVASPIAGRGVLLDVARTVGSDGELPDGFAITTEHLEQTIEAQGASSAYDCFLTAAPLRITGGVGIAG